MQIILLKDVEKLGKKGEFKQVRNGFGRNFLLPRGLALAITRDNKAHIENEQKRVEQQKTRKRAGSENLAQKIAALKLRLEVTVGEKDKLFGSVTAQDIADALAKQGVKIDKKQLNLPEPIRSLGKHTVFVELEAGVKADLQIETVRNAQSGAKS